MDENRKTKTISKRIAASLITAATICGAAAILPASALTLENGSFSIVATDTDGNTAQRGMRVEASTGPGGGTTNPGGGTTNPGNGGGGTDPGTGNPGTGPGTTPTCVPGAAEAVAKLEASAAKAITSSELRAAVISAGASVNPDTTSPKMRVAPLSIGEVAVTVDRKAAQEAACAGDDLLSAVSLSVSYNSQSQLYSGYSWVSVANLSATISGSLDAPEGRVLTTGILNIPETARTTFAQASALEVKLPPLVAAEVKKALR